jgi:hypothetical protein
VSTPNYGGKHTSYSLDRSCDAGIGVRASDISSARPLFFPKIYEFPKNKRLLIWVVESALARWRYWKLSRPIDSALLPRPLSSFYVERSLRRRGRTNTFTIIIESFVITYVRLTSSRTPIDSRRTSDRFIVTISLTYAVTTTQVPCASTWFVTRTNIHWLTAYDLYRHRRGPSRTALILKNAAILVYPTVLAVILRSLDGRRSRCGGRYDTSRRLPRGRIRGGGRQIRAQFATRVIVDTWVPRTESAIWTLPSRTISINSESQKKDWEKPAKTEHQCYPERLHRRKFDLHSTIMRVN